MYYEMGIGIKFFKREQERRKIKTIKNSFLNKSE